MTKLGAPTAAAAAAGGRTVEELKSELWRLVRAITDETDDGMIKDETYKEAGRALGALKELHIGRGNGNRNAILAEEIPDQFLCPISSEIMKDPVVLATGETYDRPFIEEWLNSGKRTCPRTQQIISDLNLRPNNALRRMISEWCAGHGVVLPPVDSTHENVVTRNDRNRFNGLLQTISTSSAATEKKQALRELRQLTKLHASYRAMLGESPDAIPKLLAVLSAPGLDSDPEVKEDTVTTILNLSIHDSNKKTVGEIPQVIPFLIESLKTGSMEIRGNSAAALFTLSALDSNKTKIGELGAMRPLMELLEQDSPAAKRDAASAVFNLCLSHENRGRAVKEGAVAVLLKCIADRSLVDESLAVLAMLAGDREAVEEVGEGGGVACLLRVIRESSCARSRENAAVVLYSVCVTDRKRLREVMEEEGTISRLAQTGTSRARRKAAGILERLRRTTHSTHYSC